ESQLSKMARYQQRLRGTEQAEREGAVPKGAPVLYPSTSPSDPYAAAKPSDESGRQLGRRGQDQPTQPAVPVVPSGLASVAVELPEADPAYYRTFFFTTPRGDVAVAGRAASTDLIVGGRNVLIVLAGFVLLIVLVRTRAARWLATRPGGFALVVLGGLLTFSCLLPLLGVVLIATGVVVIVAPQSQVGGYNVC
ncbi:MAG: hypothetical protein GX621_07130, partial [Pirellulaceae bacterium]|nr:hypothetical protein [Pirellulaceae bacterium]